MPFCLPHIENCVRFSRLPASRSLNKNTCKPPPFGAFVHHFSCAFVNAFIRQPTFLQPFGSICSFTLFFFEHLHSICLVFLLRTFSSFVSYLWTRLLAVTEAAVQFEQLILRSRPLPAVWPPAVFVLTFPVSCHPACFQVCMCTISAHPAVSSYMSVHVKTSVLVSVSLQRIYYKSIPEYCKLMRTKKDLVKQCQFNKYF